MYWKGIVKKAAACVVSLALLVSAAPALPSSALAAGSSAVQTDGSQTNRFITSDILRIEDGVVYGVEEYTTVDNLLSMFNPVSEGTLQVIDQMGTVVWGSVKEGDNVQYVVDGTVVEQLTIGAMEEYVIPEFTTSVPNGGVTSENVIITTNKDVEYHVEYLGYVDDFDGYYDGVGSKLVLGLDAHFTVKFYAPYSSKLLWTYTVTIHKTPVINASAPNDSISDQNVTITSDREVSFLITCLRDEDDGYSEYKVKGTEVTLDVNGYYEVLVEGDNGWEWYYTVTVRKANEDVPNGVITSDSLRIEDGVVYGIEEYTSVAELLLLFNPVPEGKLQVINQDGAVIAKQYDVSEGDRIQYVVNGEVIEQLTIGALDAYVRPVFTTTVPDGSYTNQDVTITVSKEVEYHLDYIGYVDDFDGCYYDFAKEIKLGMNAKHTVVAYLEDGTTWTYTVHIRKDPIAFSGVQEGSIVPRDVNLRADRDVRFTVNGVEAEGYARSVQLTESGTYEVKAADRYGNETSISFTIDKRPTYTATVPSGQLTDSDVTITVSQPVNFMVGDAIVATGTEYTVTGEGVTDVKIYTLLGTYVGTYRANISQQEFKLTGVPESGLAKGRVALRTNFRAMYTINGVTDENYVFGVNIVESGEYTVTATDQRGNAITVSFVLDCVKPTFTASVPSGQLTGGISR